MDFSVNKPFLQFRLSEEPVDVMQEMQFLQNPSCGALVTFTGWVRMENEGKQVNSLQYRAYPALAVKEGETLLQEVWESCHPAGISCVHRTGHLQVGDLAVWIGVAAPHRAEAFAACQQVIDQLKQRVPIWKKEFYPGLSSEWIH
ncbi:MAG: molybdenum cofactor biosynthesis protein MoaE [Opitutales bacterium]|nr:molybdenum cofactor biosynthesis protein MoaE [Opitutales bacterium]MCH8540521.1 molybdenum cofactor biosynthesis protein MoaE [Opitutales bacterium]